MVCRGAFRGHSIFVQPSGPSYTGAYGAASHRTFGVLGKDVNLAARLMSQADDGCILVSPSIAKAVEPWFELREQPPLLLKGLDSGVAPHLVISQREAARTSGRYRSEAGDC